MQIDGNHNFRNQHNAHSRSAIDGYMPSGSLIGAGSENAGITVSSSRTTIVRGSLGGVGIETGSFSGVESWPFAAAPVVGVVF